MSSSAVMFTVLVVVGIILPPNVTPRFAACTNNCDISVEDFVIHDVRPIELGESLHVSFNVTFKNRDEGHKVVEAVPQGVNFDCHIFSAIDNRVGDSFPVNDAVKFRDESCHVNESAMRSDLQPLQRKSLPGNCSVQIKNIHVSCPKYICVDCPKPANSSYTADIDKTNNRKCVAIPELERKKFPCTQDTPVITDGVGEGANGEGANGALNVQASTFLAFLTATMAIVHWWWDG